MNLSITHIQKINNFLEAMDIEFIDIRLEMIDHLATEIEQNFVNIPVFFEGRGFEIPFVKFMMSKKPALLKEYKAQVKRKKWSDFGFIAKKTGLQLTNPLILSFLLVLSGLCWYFAQLFFTPTLVSLVVIIFIVSCYYSYTIHQQTKKIGKIKLLHSYVIMGSFCAAVSVQAMNLSGLIMGKSNMIGLYILIPLMIFQVLLFVTYLSEKEKINQKYSYLISE